MMLTPGWCGGFAPTLSPEAFNAASARNIRKIFVADGDASPERFDHN
jgi:hypothetical protein